MPAHTGPITCIASVDLDSYYVVEAADTQDNDNFMIVKPTDSTASIAIGVTLSPAKAGEIVSVMPIIPGGVVPVRVRINTADAWPGVGVTFSTADEGRLSTFPTDHPVGYILRSSVNSTYNSIVHVIFVRCQTGA